MATQKLIAIKEFCVHHNISTSFVLDLHQNQLIELVTIKRSRYIPENNLQRLEKILRLYNDLEINIEGIQTILQLLTSIEKKETELKELRNKLDFYMPGK